MTDSVTLRLKVEGGRGTNRGGVGNEGQGKLFVFDATLQNGDIYYWDTRPGGVGSDLSGGDGGGLMYIGKQPIAEINENDISGILCVAAGGSGSSGHMLNGTRSGVHAGNQYITYHNSYRVYNGLRLGGNFNTNTTPGKVETFSVSYAVTGSTTYFMSASSTQNTYATYGGGGGGAGLYGGKNGQSRNNTWISSPGSSGASILRTVNTTIYTDSLNNASPGFTIIGTNKNIDFQDNPGELHVLKYTSNKLINVDTITHHYALDTWDETNTAALPFTVTEPGYYRATRGSDQLFIVVMDDLTVRDTPTTTTVYEMVANRPHPTLGGLGTKIRFSITKKYPYTAHWNFYDSSHVNLSHQGGTGVYLGFVENPTIHDLSRSDILAIAGGGGGYGKETYDVDEQNFITDTSGGNAGNNSTIFTDHTFYSSPVEYRVFYGSAGYADISYLNEFGEQEYIPVGGTGGTYQDISNGNNLGHPLFEYGKGYDGSFLSGGRGGNHNPFDPVDTTETRLLNYYSRGGSGGAGFYGGGGGLGIYNISTGGGGGSSLLNIHGDNISIEHYTIEPTDETTPYIRIHGGDKQYSTGSLAVNTNNMIRLQDITMNYSTNPINLANPSLTSDTSFISLVDDTGTLTHADIPFADLSFVIYQNDTQFVMPESTNPYVTVVHHNDPNNTIDLSYNSTGSYVVYVEKTNSLGITNKISNHATITIQKGVQPNGPLTFTTASTHPYSPSESNQRIPLSVTGGVSTHDVSFVLVSQTTPGEHNAYISGSSLYYTNTGYYTVRATRDGSYNYLDLVSSNITFTVNKLSQATAGFSAPIFSNSTFVYEPVSGDRILNLRDITNTDAGWNSNAIHTYVLTGNGNPSGASIVDSSLHYTFAGTYTFQITRDGSLNYLDAISNNNTLQITKKVQTSAPIFISNPTIAYYDEFDQSPISLLTFVNNSGGWSNDTNLLQFSLTSSPSGTSITDHSLNYTTAGVYEFTITRDGSMNYQDAVSTGNTLIIPKITVSSASTIYHDYDSTVNNRILDLSTRLGVSTTPADAAYASYFDISYTITSGVHANTASITNTNFQFLNAGTYEITVYNTLDTSNDSSTNKHIRNITVNKITQPSFPVFSPEPLVIYYDEIDQSPISLGDNVTGGWSNETSLLQFSLDSTPTNSSASTASSINQNTNLFTYDVPGIYEFTITRDGSLNYTDQTSTQQQIYVTDVSLTIADDIYVTYDPSPNNRIIDLSSTFGVSLVPMVPQGSSNYDISYVITSGNDSQTASITNTSFQYTNTGTYTFTVTNLLDPESTQNKHIQRIIVQKQTQPSAPAFISNPNPTITYYDEIHQTPFSLIPYVNNGGWSDDTNLLHFDIMNKPSSSSSIVSSNGILTYDKAGIYTFKVTRQGGLNYHDISTESNILYITKISFTVPSPITLSYHPSLSNRTKDLSVLLGVTTTPNDVNNYGAYDISYTITAGTHANTASITNASFQYTNVDTYDITVHNTSDTSNDSSTNKHVRTITVNKIEQPAAPEYTLASVSYNPTPENRIIDLRQNTNDGWSSNANLSYVLTGNANPSGASITGNTLEYTFAGTYQFHITRDGSLNYFDRTTTTSQQITVNKIEQPISSTPEYTLASISYNPTPENRIIDLRQDTNDGWSQYADLSYVLTGNANPSGAFITDYSLNYITAGTYQFDITRDGSMNYLDSTTTSPQSLIISKIQQSEFNYVSTINVSYDDVLYKYNLGDFITNIGESTNTNISYSITGKSNPDTYPNSYSVQNETLTYKYPGTYAVQITQPSDVNYETKQVNTLLNIGMIDYPIAVTFEVGGGSPPGYRSGFGAKTRFTVLAREHTTFYWKVLRNSTNGGHAVYVGYTELAADTNALYSTDLSQVLCIVGGGGASGIDMNERQEYGFGGTAGFENPVQFSQHNSNETETYTYTLFHGHSGKTYRDGIGAAGGGDTTIHSSNETNFFLQNITTMNTTGNAGNGFFGGQNGPIIDNMPSGGGGGSSLLQTSKILSNYTISPNLETNAPFVRVYVQNLSDSITNTIYSNAFTDGSYTLNYKPISLVSTADYSYNDQIDLLQLTTKHSHAKTVKDISYNQLTGDSDNPLYVNSNNNNLYKTSALEPVDVTNTETPQYTIRASLIDPSGIYNTYLSTDSVQIHVDKIEQPTPLSFTPFNSTQVFVHDPRDISFTVVGGWDDPNGSDISYTILYAQPNQPTPGNPFTEFKRENGITDASFSYVNIGTYTIRANKHGKRNYYDLHHEDITEITRATQTPLVYNNNTTITFQPNDVISLNSNTIKTAEEPNCDGIITYDISQTIGTPTGYSVLNSLITDSTHKFTYDFVGLYTIIATKDGSTNYFDISATFDISINKAKQSIIQDLSLVRPFETTRIYDPIQKDISFQIDGGWDDLGDLSCIVQYTHPTDSTQDFSYPRNSHNNMIQIDQQNNDISFSFVNAGTYEIIVTRDGSHNFFDTSFTETVVIDPSVQTLLYEDLIERTYVYLNDHGNTITGIDLSALGIIYKNPYCDGNITYEIMNSTVNAPSGYFVSDSLITDSTHTFSYQYIGKYTIKASIDGSTNFTDADYTFDVSINKARQYLIADLSLIHPFETIRTYDPIQKDISFTVQGGWNSTGELSCDIQYTTYADITPLRTHTYKSSDILIQQSTDDISFAYGNSGLYHITITRDGGYNFHDISFTEDISINRAIQSPLQYNDISFTFRAYNSGDTTVDLSALSLQHDSLTVGCEGNISYDVSDVQFVPTTYTKSDVIIDDTTHILDYSFVGLYTIVATRDGSTNYHDISASFDVSINKAYQSEFYSVSFDSNSIPTDISYSNTPSEKHHTYSITGGWDATADVIFDISYTKRIAEQPNPNTIYPYRETNTNGTFDFTYENTGTYSFSFTKDGSHNYYDEVVHRTIRIDPIPQSTFSFNMDISHNYHLTQQSQRRIPLITNGGLNTADISFTAQRIPNSTANVDHYPTILYNSPNLLVYNQPGDHSVIAVKYDSSYNHFDISDSIILDIRKQQSTLGITGTDFSFNNPNPISLYNLISGLQSTGTISYDVSDQGIFLGDFSTDVSFLQYSNIGRYHITIDVSGDEEYFQKQVSNTTTIHTAEQTPFVFAGAIEEYNKTEQRFDLTSVTIGGSGTGELTYEFVEPPIVDTGTFQIINATDLSYSDISVCTITAKKSGKYYFTDSINQTHEFQNYFNVESTNIIEIRKITQTIITQNVTFTYTKPTSINLNDYVTIVSAQTLSLDLDQNVSINGKTNSNYQYIFPPGIYNIKISQQGDRIHRLAVSDAFRVTVSRPNRVYGNTIQDFVRLLEAVTHRTEVRTAVEGIFFSNTYTLIEQLPPFPLFSQYGYPVTAIRESTVFDYNLYGGFYGLIPNATDFIRFVYSGDTTVTITRTDASNNNYRFTTSDGKIDHVFSSGQYYTLGNYEFVFDVGVFFESIPPFSFCVPPPIPIDKTNVSDRQLYAHRARYSKYSMITQGRARNIIFPSEHLTRESFRVQFDTVGDPVKYTFVIRDSNLIETRYDVNSANGNTYDFVGLVPNHNYLVDIIVQYATKKPYKLSPMSVVTTLPLISQVQAVNITTNSFTVIFTTAETDTNKYAYTVECTRVHDRQSIAPITNTMSGQSGSVNFASLDSNTKYAFKVLVYRNSQLLQWSGSSIYDVVYTEPIV